MNANGDRRPRALLIDDDPTVLRLLGTALEARGYAVRAALDAESGLEALLDEILDLDVLVADLELPGRDGASLLRLVRHAGGERELGVVLLAGGVPADHRRQLLALGADAVVDRSAGPAAAIDAIAAVARRDSRPERRWLEAARPMLRGALLVARAALTPPRLAARPA